MQEPTEAVARAANETVAVTSQTYDTLVALGTAYGLRVIGALIGLFAAWIVGGWVRSLIRNGLGKANFDATLTRFFASFARYAVITVGVVAVLGVFGVETASFAAILAALGLAIGLAFQGTLSNFSSGVMLLVFRPFKVGDFINAGGVLGTVAEIDLFTCAIDTLDYRRFIVPNSQITGGTIENISHHSVRRCDVDVGVEYSADIDKVREVLDAAVKSLDKVRVDPPHQVFLKGLGASSVDWAVRIWVDAADYWVVHEAAVRAVKKHLDAAGIGIPVPQMDVHVDGRLDRTE